MKKTKWRQLLFYFRLVFALVLSVGFLASCGGGGGGGGGGSSSSNWDQMLWDQNNWE